MAARAAVCVEVGSRRVFAGARDWPGWCRSARDEASALEALVAYARRYRAAIGHAGGGFVVPTAMSGLRVVERLEGNTTTDFGAPGIAPAHDARALGGAELARQLGLLRACWNAFDASAKAARSATLRKGPRGGGRTLAAIVAHILEADQAYVTALGGRFRAPAAANTATVMARMREGFIETIAARARGEPPAPSRRQKPPWTPRYAVRRSAWHALDHAWEIEDRAGSR